MDWRRVVKDKESCIILNFITYIVKSRVFNEIENTMQNNILIPVLRCES